MHVTCKVRVTEKNWVAVLRVVANEGLEAVVLGVMYVAHQPVEPLVAGSRPLRHLSGAAAYWPKQLVANQTGAVQRLHDYLGRVFAKQSFSLKIFGFELVVIHARCGNHS